MARLHKSKKKKKERKLKTLLKAYANLIRFSHKKSTGVASEYVNCPIKSLNSKVFASTFRDAWSVINFREAFVFVEVGYVIKHEANQMLRWFYPAANSSLFQKASFISDKSSVNHFIDKFKKEEPYLITKFMNSAPKSGYVFVCFTNIKYVFLKPKPVLRWNV